MRARKLGFILVAAGLWFGAATVRAADTDTLLNSWFAVQTNLHTWQAQAIQTRTITTFSHPLVSTGRVWVATPDRFRWELGQPAQTVALRLPEELVLIYPRLKRAERYSLDAKHTGPWRDALALLDASFPRNRAALESQFQILGVTQTNAVVSLSLQPRSSFARKFMTGMEVSFCTNNFTPVSTELRFSDGSSMRNDFSQSVVNEPIAQEVFDAKLPADFKVVEPLKP